MRAILTGPISCQMWQLWRSSLGTSAIPPCSQRLTVSRTGKISPAISPPLSSHPGLPFISLRVAHPVLSPAGSALSPALFAEELLLDRGVFLQGPCIHSHELSQSQEVVAAQEHKCSRRCDFLCPTHSLEMLPGLWH